MKAAVFHHPKEIRCDRDVPDPRLEDARDAIVRVTSTAICGSDLHIYNGLLPQVKPMVMGHEFMGIVEDVGSDVRRLKRGDRVIVPFPIACGTCYFCSRGMVPHCENSNPEHYGPEGGILTQKGGGLFGYTDLYGGYAGGQAEAVRVPYADFGPRVVPDELNDEQVLFLTDILPTGWTAVEWCGLRGGETVAVFGCGPVGLMAQKIAWLRGAGRVIGIDIEDYRLETAARTARSEVLSADRGDIVETLREMTDGRGPDAVIDAVGMEANRNFLQKVSAALHGQRGTIECLRRCIDAVRRGGTLSIVGVYGTPYDNFPLSQIFDKGLTIRTGQAPAHNFVDELLELVLGGKLVADDIITHRLPLDQVEHAYTIFNAKQEQCVKVVLKP